MKKQDEEQSPRLQRALWRYQVIAGYLALAPRRGGKRKLLEELAAKTWVTPEQEPVAISAETLRAWVRRYRRSGLDGLLDKGRPARGTKVLSEEQVSLVCRLKEEVPERSLERIIRIAEETGLVERSVLRRSTVHRVLRSRGLSARGARVPDKQDLDRFEAEFPNDLWQSDMLVGPWLPDPDRPRKMKRAQLFAFLDDHSRLLLSGRFGFREGLPHLELVFRQALQKWGVPRRAYYDNGKVYRADHMKHIAAELGIYRVIHTRPYRPEGHGKIEALNRFIRSSFLAELRVARITTLDELNEAFAAWCAAEYNGRVHAETSESPLTRWRKGASKVRFADEERLRQAFFWQETRTPDKTGLFSLLGVRYQVGPALARRKVDVRFDPEALFEVEVWHNGSFVERVRPFSVTAHRRPRPQESAAPANAEQPAANWLGHLVAAERRERIAEPQPQSFAEAALAAREQNARAVIDLFTDKLEPSVVDAAAIRDNLDRHAPIDIDLAADALDELLSNGAPRDQHVSFYLDALRVAQQGGQR